MGIKINSGLVQPEILFDKVHVINLEITQPIFTNNALFPVYRVFIQYRLYGVGSENTRHYHHDIKEIEIPNFIPKAMKIMELGNPLLINTLGILESAIAFIIANEEQINAEVV
jgi:hypothetical protein